MNNPLEWTGTRAAAEPPGQRGRVLIVGARRDRRRLARCLGQGPWAGLPVVGFVDAGHARYSGGSAAAGISPSTPRSDPVPVLGGIDRLDELVDRVAGHPRRRRRSRARPAKRIRPQIAQLTQLRRRRPLGLRRGPPVAAATPDLGRLGGRQPPWPWRWATAGQARRSTVLGRAIGLLLLVPAVRRRLAR